ncbi:MAG: hypothetical protein IH956_08055 [Chloroflexi bacterium]|nr:hypothetical protein [Chloroflexota bacterium]
MQIDEIRADELTPEETQAVLAFLNAATVNRVAKAVEVPGKQGGHYRAAVSIMSKRSRLRRFTDIQEVANIPELGAGSFTALVKAVRELDTPPTAGVSPVGITSRVRGGNRVAPGASGVVSKQVASVRREDAPPAEEERAATKEEDKSMAATRSYTAGRFALTADSGVLGFLKKYAGGSIKAEVATYQVGPGNLPKKHITRIIYEDLTIDVDMGMSTEFYEWIDQAFDNVDVAKNVEVHACDFDQNSMDVRECSTVQISEVTIPALDGSSKEPAYLTVKLVPESIRYRPGDGSGIADGGVPAKRWLSSNFQFSLGDLPCSRVAKIDSFTWKRSFVRDEVGAFREPTNHPAEVEVPNLKLTVSMADINSWQAWFQSFVIDGRCSEADELSGAITFLAPDLRQELAEIQISNVGIIGLDTVTYEANREEVARFTVELYCEQMKFRVAK